MELIRVIIVIALVLIASVMAMPKNKTPIALSGIKKLLKLDRGEKCAPEPAPLWKRIVAFILVIAAAAIALW
mgnify:CR=1 FL=1